MTRQLSQREKNLSIGVGGAFLLLLTFGFGNYFLTNKARLDAELLKANRDLKTLQNDLAEKPLYEQREAWLREKQPKLANEDGAGVQLLDQIKELAKKHTVLPDNPRMLPGLLRKSEYTAVGVGFETKSTWRNLIAFLTELQGPEQFIVLDSVNLKIDPADNTQMRGSFKVSRWYAPK